LRRQQARNSEDLARLVPAVTFSQNTGFSQLFIRGIGTNAVFTGSDPSSAVYFDGVYVARPAMVLTDLLDVERVEVLRGPQGTLYGRNAVGGALNIVSKIPTNDFDVSGRFMAASQGPCVAKPE
jgi:iron complex outermembrane receptor protein